MKTASRNRQPIWSLSSVVLFSTLLLSPVTAATLLRVLSQSLPQNAASNTVLPSQGTKSPAQAKTASASSASPRRSGDEENALRRAAARTAKLRAARLDDEPEAVADSRASVSFAHYSLAHALLVSLLAPTHADAPELTPTANSAPAFRRQNDTLPARIAVTNAPSRAPPANA